LNSSANENKRQGGGSRNWGNVKDAQADHEAVSSVPVEQLEGVPVVEGAAAPVEGAEVAAEIKVEAEPEVRLGWWKGKSWDCFSTTYPPRREFLAFESLPIATVVLFDDSFDVAKPFERRFASGTRDTIRPVH
jgi:hypothetical protein